MAEAKNKLSPVMMQYLDLKSENQSDVVVFLVGNKSDSKDKIFQLSTEFSLE